MDTHVPAPKIERPRHTTLHFRLPLTLLERIDRQVHARQMTRSEVIRDVLERGLPVQ